MTTLIGSSSRPRLSERAIVALVAALVLLLLGLAGCSRRTVPVAQETDPDVVPGIIDVGFEGFSEGHHALAAKLGEVLEDERLEDDPLDDVDDPEELVVLRVDPGRAAFADDIVVNLKPAHDMGMRTVWIRTDESVKRAEGLDLDHIHHQTDDLATWLADWVAERSVKK